jgi:signal transduction histidine kinase
MHSLGRLAAGLAHELNNPASAVARSAQELAGCLSDVEAAARALGKAELSDEQLVVVKRFGERCMQTAGPNTLSPIERADREDAVTEWLDGHKVDPDVAVSLAESGVMPAELEEMASTVSGRPLEIVLKWIAAVCATRRLAGEIESAASRIHNLVSAIKGFTYMDQNTSPVPVDIGKGLADTLTLLKGKAKKKSVDVHLQVDASLPKIEGLGGELNQIWQNLIDNALDAVPEGGHVAVEAAPNGEKVVVQVIDDGPGIPKEIRERIFDPFFTTKPIGLGSGLGLDIVQRVVRRHGGEIALDTRPGRTEFRVTLPLVMPGPRLGA